jgi:transformation/transcription domain-associated protein
MVVKFMVEQMSVRWVLEHQYVFLRALLFVMMDLTGEVSSGALDLAKANLEDMLKLCASITDPDLVPMQSKYMCDVIHELVRQVASPITLVREQV